MANEAKRILQIGLILGILICVLGCASLTTSSTSYSESYPYEKMPIRKLSIKIDENQRDELFAQLKQFSKQNHLSFDLNFFEGSQGEEIFFFKMHGEGLEISALSSPAPYAKELDINFYEEDPGNSPSQDTLDKLFNNLRAFISEIPGMVIIGE
jgi:hypothetical protein